MNNIIIIYVYKYKYSKYTFHYYLHHLYIDKYSNLFLNKFIILNYLKIITKLL